MQNLIIVTLFISKDVKIEGNKNESFAHATSSFEV